MEHLKCKTFPLIFLILSLVSFVTKSSAQKITWVGHLDETDGLSERIVERITRDKNGYFYFFTPKSIQQYDGKTISNISLPENYTFVNSGIQNIVDNYNQPIILIENSTSKSLLLQNNQLTTLQSPLIESFNSKDSIFISGNNAELYLFQKIGEETYKVFDGLSEEILISEINLSKIPERCFIDNNRSVIIMEDKNHKLSFISTNNTSLNLPASGSLVVRDNFLIISSIDGIYSLNNNKVLDTLHTFPSPLSKPYWAKTDDVGNVLFAYNKSIATINNLILLKSDNSVEKYNKILSISENIKDIYSEDFTKKMILGTYNGVYILNFKSQGINSHVVRPGLSVSEFGNVISGIAWSKVDSNIYFTRETNGLFRLNKDKSIDTLNLNDQYINNNYLTINPTGDKLYSSSFNVEQGGTFNIYDIKNSTRTRFPVDFLIQTICPIKSKKVLLAGGKKPKNFLREAGEAYAVIYDAINDSIEKQELPTAIQNLQIRSSYYDEERNHFWLGTINGLFCLDANFNILVTYDNAQSNSLKTMLGSHIRMIKKIDDLIYIGTLSSGLYIIDPETQNIISHIDKQSKNLSANSIICAESDSKGNIWAGSFSGLNVIAPSTELVGKFHFNSGISNPEFNTMASAKNENGELFFGTINGITEINPELAISSFQKENLVIEDVIEYSKGTLRHIDGPYKNISLKQTVDSVLIKYNIPDYYKFHFTYDKEFIDVKNYSPFTVSHFNNAITIKDLKIGDNKLEVISRYSNQVLDLNFYVKRNFIPYIITGIAVISLISLWYFISFQRIQSRKQLEKEKIKFNKQLAEMELTALRAQMNPHFIFNALGAIQYFINTQNIEKADDYLTKFAKLMRSILESTKSKHIQLDDEINLLKLYTSLEHIRFEEKFDYTFEIDPELDLIALKIPSMIIQPFVENAVNHGLYHLDGRKGYLRIAFQEISEDKIRCIIEDNGIGRDAAKEISVSKNHKSRGMQIVNERIEALKQAKNYDIDISVTDPKNHTGTIVVIDIHLTY